VSTNKYDVFGNVVEQTFYANSSLSADYSGVQIPDTDAQNDQSIYRFYNAYGNEIQSIDAEGSAKYFSYDAQGRVNKQWQLLTDLNANTQQAATLYSYDLLGQQTGSTDLIASNPINIPSVIDVSLNYVNVASTAGAVWTGYNDGYGTTYSWVGGNEHG